MRPLTLTLLLMGSACGSIGFDEDSAPVSSCNVGPLVSADWQLDCQRVAAEVQLARQILVDRQVTDAEELDRALTGLEVRAYDVGALDCESWVAGICTVKVWGRHYLRDGVPSIKLERSGRALAHEFIHQLQAIRGELPGHDNWKEFGFEAADAEFQARHQSWR